MQLCTAHWAHLTFPMDPPRKRNFEAPVEHLPSVASARKVAKTTQPQGLKKEVVLTNAAAGATSSSSSSSNALPGARPAEVGGEKLRDVIRDIFLTNKLSGRDTALLSRAGANSGATGIADLAAAGARGRHPQNAARDIMRQLLRDTDMPELVWFPVRSWDPATMTSAVHEIPFLLPHLVLSQWKDKVNTMQLSMEKAPEIWKSFEESCTKLGLNPKAALPLGLHGDGVPFSKKQSLELISWNILGDPNQDRIPFSGISKAYICKCGCLGRCSWNDVTAIFAWSMRALLVGKHPALDVTGNPLQGPLVELAGTPLGVKACLCQERGDWPFLKALFSLPQWNSKLCCWQCAAANDKESPQ